MRCIMVLGALSGVGGSLAAQSPQADLDRRVWVREPVGNGTFSHGVKGTLERTSGDTLFVRPANGAVALALPPRQGRRLLFSNGRRSSVGQGLLIGTGLGVAAGAILGFASGQDCSAGEWLCFDRGTMAAMGGLTLGAGGLVVGIIAGALSSHEVWTSEQPARLLPLLGPTKGGMGVGMSLSF